MTNPLLQKSWSPYVVGAGIGILSWFAFASADHPLGVTTAFENSAALSARGVMPTIEHSNEYYAKKAAEGKPLKIGWEYLVYVTSAFAINTNSRTREKLDGEIDDGY